MQQQLCVLETEMGNSFYEHMERRARPEGLAARMAEMVGHVRGTSPRPPPGRSIGSEPLTTRCIYRACGGPGVPR